MAIHCESIIRALVFFLVVVMVTAGLHTESKAKVSSPFRSPDEGSKLVFGSTEFALKLFKQLSVPGRDVIFSPTSISFGMAMTYLGSASSTAEEMKGVLGFTNVHEDHVHTSFADLHSSLMKTEGNYNLSLANRLYGQQSYPFLSEFQENARKHYETEMQNVDFRNDSTRLHINQWVSDQTNQKIDTMLSDALNPQTRMMLVNAIHFKGDWAEKFDVRDTKKEKFYRGDGSSVDVDMMQMEGDFSIDYIDDLDTMALDIPYKGKALSMVILLPEAKDGLAKLEAGLTAEHLMNLRLGRRTRTDAKVWLPRFTLEASASLGETLADMGMPEVFTEGSADLSKMDGTRYLYLSKVLHKAFIEVNEEGSEAAAAVVSDLVLLSAPLRFRADHPFLFMIRCNRTKALLFMGKLENPTKSSGKDEL